MRLRSWIIILFSIFLLLLASCSDDSNPVIPSSNPIIYEGKTYNTVKIGEQIWLKENLDVGTMIQGIEDAVSGNGIEKYCYGNDSSNCETYGGLYQWNEAMQYVTTEGTQGICPDDWHIPTLAEYETLESFVAAQLVREDQPATGYTPNNETDFSGLFAGYRDYYNGDLNYLGYYTYFWSSTELNSYDAHSMDLNYDAVNFDFGNYDKDYGFNVRCIKD